MSSPPSADVSKAGDGSVQQGWSSWSSQWGWTILVPLVFVAFGRALRFAFVYDDRWTILENPLLRDPRNALALLGSGFARSGVPDAGRPLLLLTEIFDWTLWGSNPRGFHLQNLLWHALAVVFAQRLLLRWGASAAVSFAAAAWFAVHPLLTEAVVVINYREDALAAALMFAGLALVAPGRRLSVTRLTAAVLTTTLAVLAKESAMVAPLWLLALIACRPAAHAQADAGNKSGWGRWRSFGPAMLAVSLPAIGGFLWRWWAFGAPAVVSLGAEIPVLHRQMIWALPRGFVTYARGLAQFVWPAGLAPEYPDLPATIAPVGWLVGAAVLTLTAVAWRSRRGPRLALPALGWCLALAGYLPNLGMVPLTNLRADRYFYLPVLGWSVLVVSLIGEGLAALERRRAVEATATRFGERVLASGAPLLALLVVAVFVARARQYSGTLRTEVSLFSAAVASDPGSQRAAVGLALAQLRAGQTLAAGEAAARAVALSPAPRALEARALVALAQGDPAAARVDLERAVSGTTGRLRAQILYHLGIAESRMAAPEAASAHWRESMQIDPGFDRPVVALAIAALGADDNARARAILEDLLARMPTSLEGWRALVRVHEQGQRPDEAARARQRLQRLLGD